MSVFKGGLVIPLITPFNSKLEIDYEGLSWLIKHLVENRVDALFPISTTGEFPSLTMDEKIDLVEHVVKESGETPVIAGISGTCIDEVVGLGREFIDIGADYLITTPPYYYKPSKEGLIQYFSRLLSSLDIDILIYTIPSLTGVDITPDLLYDLKKEHSNLKGVKATVDSLIYFRRVIQVVKSEYKDFIVLSGIDEYILPLMMLGGDGGVAALAHLKPEIHKSLITKYQDGEYEDAISIYNNIMSLKRIYDVSPSTTAAIKAALNIMKYPISRAVRPPLTPVDKDSEEKIRRILRENNLI